MAKRQSSQTATGANAKRTIHLDALADGVLDALATARKMTNSELVSQLLINELYRIQGTEREAVRAVLKHQGIDIPRRNSNASREEQGGSSDESTDGLTARAERLGEVAQAAYRPVDDAIELVSSELNTKSIPRPSRFGSSN